MTGSNPPALSQWLKTETHDAHALLDGTIMARAGFASREGYCRFLAVQHRFHADIAGLYADPGLAALIPGLAARDRSAAIAADLADLAAGQPDIAPAPAPADDLPTALGWLYVAEGSKLGGALLRKEAAALGLSDSHGARHLAPAPGGPAAHWRAFTGALDAVVLHDDERSRAVAGARSAFARFQNLVERIL